MGATTPEIAVLVPLHDARGDFVHHLRSWTDGQTFACDRYQVVVASGPGDRRAKELVRGLLAPQDRLVESSVPEVSAMWNAAAAAASAPWLVVTEGHCSGANRVLEVLTETLRKRPEIEVARLEDQQIAKSRGGELCRRWFASVYEAWGAHDKPHLNTVATLIRRDLFDEVGGFDESLGMFSHVLLAAQLHDRGKEIFYIAGPPVVHMNTDSVAQHNGFVTSYTRGECAMRERHKADFCDRYLDHDQVWNNRLRYQADVARAARWALLDTVRRKTTSSGDRGWLLGELRSWSATGRGVGRQVTLEKAKSTCFAFVAERFPVPWTWRWKAFLRSHDSTVRHTRLQWIRANARPVAMAESARRVWPAPELDGTRLAGGHGIESHDGQVFRWTEPVAVLRLGPDDGDGRLTIDTAGLRGDPASYLVAAYAGRRRIEDWSVEGGRIEFRLGLAEAAEASRHGISLLSRPLRPERHGSSDRRHLGIPVVSVGWRPEP